MAKKNNYITANLSFEDFEQSLNSPLNELSPDELLKTKQAQDAAARKKDAELKKAYQRKKRELKLKPKK